MILATLPFPTDFVAIVADTWHFASCLTLALPFASTRSSGECPGRWVFCGIPRLAARAPWLRKLSEGEERCRHVAFIQDRYLICSAKGVKLTYPSKFCAWRAAPQRSGTQARS